MAMDVEKTLSLLSVSWRSRKAGGIVPVHVLGPESSEHQCASPILRAWFGLCPPTRGRTICFNHFTFSKADLFHKHPYRCKNINFTGSRGAQISD